MRYSFEQNYNIKWKKRKKRRKSHLSKKCILTNFSTCLRSRRYSVQLSGSASASSLSSQLNWKAVIRGSGELRAIKLGLANARYSAIRVLDSLRGSPARIVPRQIKHQTIFVAAYIILEHAALFKVKRIFAWDRLCLLKKLIEWNFNIAFYMYSPAAALMQSSQLHLTSWGIGSVAPRSRRSFRIS